jgi:hypothetical protein
MIPSNAFVGRTEAPGLDELASVLGKAGMEWKSLIDWMGEKLEVREQEWKGVIPKKYGWSLRLRHKKRNIVHMSPCQGCFRVGFILGDRAMEKVRSTPFPADIASIIAAAPHYPEGTGITLLVKRAQDLAAVRKLAEIKVAH